MLIVFDSKSSGLIYYTFDKIKFLSPLRICIILLSKSIFKSWLVAHENWVSVICLKVWWRVTKPSPHLAKVALRQGVWGSLKAPRGSGVNDAKSFDKIKFLSPLRICIILLSKSIFKSWLVAHENWVSVGSFLVPGNCKNAGFCIIYQICSRLSRLIWNRIQLTYRPKNLHGAQ
jgi:hypothetical protein